MIAATIVPDGVYEDVTILVMVNIGSDGIDLNP